MKPTRYRNRDWCSSVKAHTWAEVTEIGLELPKPKTPHRIMYEVLDARIYKRFCRNTKPDYISYLLENKYTAPQIVLGGAFCWAESPEKGPWWQRVHDSLPTY